MNNEKRIVFYVKKIFGISKKNCKKFLRKKMLQNVKNLRKFKLNCKNFSQFDAKMFRYVQKN